MTITETPIDDNKAELEAELVEMFHDYVDEHPTYFKPLHTQMEINNYEISLMDNQHDKYFGDQTPEENTANRDKIAVHFSDSLSSRLVELMSLQAETKTIVQTMISTDAKRLRDGIKDGSLNQTEIEALDNAITQKETDLDVTVNYLTDKVQEYTQQIEKIEETYGVPEIHTLAAAPRNRDLSAFKAFLKTN